MNPSYPENAPQPQDEGVAVPPPQASQPNAEPGAEQPVVRLASPFPENGRTLVDTALPPDIRSPLGWLDLLWLVLFYVLGGVLLTVVVAKGALLLFGLSFDALEQSTQAKAIVAIVTQGLLSAATVAFLYVMVRSRSTAPFWPAVGWRAFSRGSTALGYIFGGFAMAVTVGWASRYFGNDSPLPMEELFHSRQSVLLLMALGILVAPVVEETIFRGCIYPVVARRFGIGVGVIFTGVLFGLAHAQQLWGGWGQIALLVCVGIVLTYVRARAGTVAASYFIHLGYNTILFAGFYIATGGLRHIPS